MKTRTTQSRTTRETENNSPRSSSTSPDVISTVPPEYGVDFVDRERIGTIQKKNNKTGLPDKLKSGVESLSGTAVDDVRVYYNSPKPASLHALAFTRGRDIHVGPGQERHLAHEAWHVVQQRQGRVRPTGKLRGVGVNEDHRLEREADAMGARAARGSRKGAFPAGVDGSEARSQAGFRDHTAPLQMLNVNYHSHKAPTQVGTAKVHESDGAIATLVTPADYNTGSQPTNAVRPVSQQATTVFGKRFIAGHMLNHHLGGPGNQQNNITAFTGGQNSLHHWKLERYAKNDVGNLGQNISYYTVVTKRADFYNPGGAAKLAENLASELQGGYTNLITGAKFGPITIPLGPAAPKKNETKTGMSATGASSAFGSEDFAAEIADTIAADAFKNHQANIQTVYGPNADEDEISAALLDRILAGYLDTEKYVKLTMKWLKAVQTYITGGMAGPAPDFLDTFH